MTENMVRTQVYLPRDVHAILTQRAEEQGLTLADQIRTALDEYLTRVEADESGVLLQPDDPIFKLVGLFDGGEPNLAVDHDYHLYGMPRRSLEAAPNVAETKPAYRPRSRRAGRSRKQPR